MSHSEVADVILQGIEATFYVSATADGLTFDEIAELCRRFGYQPGEIDDATRMLQQRGEIELFFSDDMVRLSDRYFYFSAPWARFDKDPRNLKLLDVIVREVEKDMRTHGEQKVDINVSIFARRLSEQANVTEQEVLIALRLLERYRCFKIADGYIRSPNRNYCSPKFIENIFKANPSRKNRGQFETILHTVKEILGRRNDGRPVSSDPFIAFEEKIEGLGFPHFISWWRSMVAELHNLDNIRNCTSVLVASASLCEAALTFLAASGRTNGLTITKKLADEPRIWKLGDLVSSGCTGQKPLLEPKLRDRLIDLNEKRRIIHAGSYISLGGAPAKVPDIRPEQAKAGRETLETLLRTSIDWLSVNNIG